MHQAQAAMKGGEGGYLGKVESFDEVMNLEQIY